MLIPVVKIIIKQLPNTKTTRKFVDENGLSDSKIPGTIILDYCETWEVNDSIDDITKTLKLTLPKKIRNKWGYFEDDLIMNGDYIEMYAGYQYSDGTSTVHRIFIGFISKVSNKVPILIEAEDYSYLLKRTACSGITWDTTISIKNIDKKQGSVEDLFNYLFDNLYYNNGPLSIKISDCIKFETDNTKTGIGRWYLSTSNSISALIEEIKSKCKFTSFIYDPEPNKNWSDEEIMTRIKEKFIFNAASYDTVLSGDDAGFSSYSPIQNFFIGLVKMPKREGSQKITKTTDSTGNSITKITPEKIFHFQKNIIDGAFEFKSAGDFVVKLVAINIQTVNGKEVRIEEIVGDINGEVRTLHFLDKFSYTKTIVDGKEVYKSKELRERAEKYLPNLKIDRAIGSFNTFGLPRVNSRDIITIDDDYIGSENLNDPYKGRQYMVKSVNTTGGINGFRQNIELDYRFDSLEPLQKDSYLANEGVIGQNNIKEN